MGRKPKKSKAGSGKPIEVTEAVVGEAKPVLTKEPTQTVTPQNAEDAAVSAVRQFYDKLIQLPLDEKAPELYSHYLITQSTLERVGKSCLVRAEKNGFILLDVLEAVQQKPDLLVVFCNLLQEIYIAAELAQLIKDKYTEEVVNLKDTATHNTTSTKTGRDCCEKMCQGWCLVPFLLVAVVAIFVSFLYPIPWPITGKAAEWQVRVPPIPSAFTGREEEVQRIVHYIVKYDVRIVSVTGGPGYGKSTVAIASSHQLMEHGTPVCYMSLSEADTMETFLMTLLHALTRKTEKHPDKVKALSWVESLLKKTVIVLDDADHLTLKQTELRQEFIKLLKNMVAESSYLHLLVVTRYRFKITSDFEEIHLQPLASHQAHSLLRCLIRKSGRVSDETIEEQLQVIINETGGIPLAIKVIGRLIKSDVVSVAEVVEDLAIDPVNTLSEDSFTPEEQLKRCINLSYRYLSTPGRKCFLLAASFPGSFDRQAKKRIVANLAGDGHCLSQLVDRSLVEYTAISKRYSVHALLRAFARDEASGYFLETFYQLYAKHYIAVLTEHVNRVKSGGNVSSLYTTLVVDYHNFLHLVNILSTNLTSSVAPKDEMELALEAFQVMQTRFPYEALLGWWTRLLEDVCLKRKSDSENLVLQGLQLSIQLAQLLANHQKYSLARHILLSASMCIDRDEHLAQLFRMCKHQQLSVYTTMLQLQSHVCEMDGALDEARRYDKTIQRCLRSSLKMKAEEIIPHNFCSDGINHVRKVHETFNDFTSAVQLFDALLECEESEAAKSIELLENAFEVHLANSPSLSASSMAALRIAKRMYLVSNPESEVKWLVKSVEHINYVDLSFYICFRLSRLYWQILNDKRKAVENGKAAYVEAMSLTGHDPIWKASVRLADILNQIGYQDEEVVRYFQEAFDQLPFISTACPDCIYLYQRFIEVNLISISFQSREFRTFIQYYGQWAKLETVKKSQDAGRWILDLFYHLLDARRANSSSLTVVDNSLHRQKGLDTMWRSFNLRIDQMGDSAMWYVQFVLKVMLLLLQMCVVCGCGCFCCCTCIYHQTPDLIYACIYLLSIVLSIVCSFHYFLYVVIVEHKVWKPNHLPRVSDAVFFRFLIGTLCIASVAYLNHLLLLRPPFLPETERYHNVSMHLPDDYMYTAID